jgi:hypothetical protein
VWIAPVTAQVMMTFRDFAMTFLSLMAAMCRGRWTSQQS